MTQIAAPLFIVAMIALSIWIKQRKIKKPVKGTGLRLLIPLFIFLAGFAYFLVQIPYIPSTRFEIPASWELITAFALGLLFGIPLMLKTEYEVRDDGHIYTKQNKGFIYIFVAILLIRIGLKQYFQSMDPITLALLTFTMALSYLGVWRIGAFVKFRKVWNSVRDK